MADLDLSRNTKDLIKSFKRLGKDLLTVTNLTSDIEDMSDPERSRNLEAACDTLRRTGVTLEAAPKKYGQEEPVLRDIRNDFYGVLQQVRSLSYEYMTKCKGFTEFSNKSIVKAISRELF